MATSLYADAPVFRAALDAARGGARPAARPPAARAAVSPGTPTRRSTRHRLRAAALVAVEIALAAAVAIVGHRAGGGARPQPRRVRGGLRGRRLLARGRAAPRRRAHAVWSTTLPAGGAMATVFAAPADVAGGARRGARADQPSPPSTGRSRSSSAARAPRSSGRGALRSARRARLAAARRLRLPLAADGADARRLRAAHRRRCGCAAAHHARVEPDRRAGRAPRRRSAPPTGAGTCASRCASRVVQRAAMPAASPTSLEVGPHPVLLGHRRRLRAGRRGRRGCRRCAATTTTGR